MCCAASEIKLCVIVFVQLLIGVTFVVFVGDGWLALVPAHLPHLRVLRLQWCDTVGDENIEKLMAAAPEVAVINRWGKIVGEVSDKLRRMFCGQGTECSYAIIRQWALD
jgi:hypothetical protein